MIGVGFKHADAIKLAAEESELPPAKIKVFINCIWFISSYLCFNIHD